MGEMAEYEMDRALEAWLEWDGELEWDYNPYEVITPNFDTVYRAQMLCCDDTTKHGVIAQHIVKQTINTGTITRARQWGLEQYIKMREGGHHNG